MSTSHHEKLETAHAGYACLFSPIAWLSWQAASKPRWHSRVITLISRLHISNDAKLLLIVICYSCDMYWQDKLPAGHRAYIAFILTRWQLLIFSAFMLIVNIKYNKIFWCQLQLHYNKAPAQSHSSKSDSRGMTKDPAQMQLCLNDTHLNILWWHLALFSANLKENAQSVCNPR